jgi:hypothetical protein
LKPVFLTVLLLVASSTAFSAERYTEVWSAVSKNKAKARNVMPVQARKKRKNVTTVKKVADKTSVAQTPALPRVKQAPKPNPAVDPIPQLPRKIGPDGLVMRVSFPAR